MKEILIDIYKANNPHSGLGQFSINFYNQLTSTPHPNFKFNFLHPSGFPHSPANQYKYSKVSALKRVAPALGPKPDIWHSLHQFPSHPPYRKSRQILTIHDLNFLTEKNETKSQRYLKKLQKNVDRADVLTTISEFTKEVVMQHLNTGSKPIHVVHNGVTLKEFESAQRPQYLNDHPFFFSIGIFSAKKNFEALLPLMRSFKDHKLVIAGNHNTPYGQLIREKAHELGITHQLILPGKIDDAEKFWLYQNCRAFLFPSLAEGFGLPVIEAALAGVPLFISDACSLPEVGGDVAHYWSDFDPDHMKEVLVKGLNDFDTHREKRIEALKRRGQHFSWERCMKRYLEIYQTL